VIATKYDNDMPQLGIAMQRLLPSQIPIYNGTGDTNAAASFKCAANKTGGFNPKPAPQYGP
jgi:hypothetical protein